MRAHATSVHAEGAWPNGARVVKRRMGPGRERHRVGALATIRGSATFAELARLGGKRLPPGLDPDLLWHCVEWDDLPGLPVWIKDDGRIAPVGEG